MSRFLFILLGFISLIAAISINGELLIFIDTTSLMLIILLPLFFTMAFHGPTGLLKAVHISLSAAKLDEQATPHEHTLSTLRVTTSASGVVGSLIGFVSMLAQMDDPSKIGPAMAVSLLTALYAVIISELLIAPMINRLRHLKGSSRNDQNPLKSSPITLLSIPIILIMFGLILVSM